MNQPHKEKMTGHCALFIACVLLMKFSRAGRNIQAVASYPKPATANNTGSQNRERK